MNARLLAAVGLCFIVGATGGTVMSMRGTPDDALAHEDELSADTVPAAVDVTDEEATQQAEPEIAAEASRDEPAQPRVAEPEPTPSRSAPAVQEPAEESRAQADSATARLARIFGAMRPEEAARLLEPLPEGDVRAVLFALSDRKAAAILAKFKGERATALARALLQHTGSR